MPPVDELSGLAQGLGNAAGGFSRALAQVVQHRQARARTARERERGELMDRLELAATPGVSVGRPEGSPAAAAAVGEVGGSVTGVPGMSGALARLMQSRAGPSETAQRMGELGGEPVYYDPVAAREATTEPVRKPWQAEGFASREEYLDYLREKELATAGPGAGEGGRDTMPNVRGYDVPVDPMEDPEGYASAVRNIEHPIYAARADARGERGGGGDQGDRPGFSKALQTVREGTYVPASDEPDAELVPPAGLTAGRETRLAHQMTRDPAAVADSIDAINEESAAPPDSAGVPAGERLAEGDEDRIPFFPDPVADFAKGVWDRVRGAGPTRDEPAAASDTASGEQRIYGAPRSKVQQAIQAAGSIDTAISRLEGLEDLRPNEEAVLEALRQLQTTGYPTQR